MYTFTKKIIRSLLAFVIAIGGLALTRSHASAALTINLCAVAGTWQPLPVTSSGVNFPIWGFADGGTGTSPVCTSAVASLPGPVYYVTAGDTVTINIANLLPGTHTINFEIPGVSFNPGPTDGSAPITFTASAGTYLYQSGGDAGRQEAMGLYGALIVRPTGFPTVPGQAYGAATTAFDVEAILVLSQVDPAFNAAPDTFLMTDYLATYWLINGKAYPDTDPILATTGQKVLLRYVNAGYDNTTMMLLGMHEQVLARDAYLLNNPFLANAETIPAGGTEDAIAAVPSSGAGPNGFALYNRQLHVTNGAACLSTGPCVPNPNYTPGGMLTFIVP